MTVFVHPQGICESTSVGDRTTVWAFAHILPGARIGEDVNINDNVFIENDVIIGDRVTIKSGVQLWDGVRLGDDVFIGPNVTFTNDPLPRSKQRPPAFAVTTVNSGASVGGGAVILPGRNIGRRAMIGAGSVVTRDVPAHAIVVGNPARIIGYCDGQVSIGEHDPSGAENPAVEGPGRVIELTTAVDMRGSLMAFDFGILPFVPARFFTVFQVPTTHTRGQHAHRRCDQFLISLAGSVNCLVDDGSQRTTYRLNNPATGLYMPAMTWGSQYGYSPDAVLGVFASLPYDKDDYIRDYEEFLVSIGRGR